MKRSRFAEHQITGILNEAEMGTPATQVCRRHAVSQSTYFK
ncbi:MAG: transposase [Acidobacteriota bacterium]|nr:transposase [Acidobacteriota bacterium]